MTLPTVAPTGVVSLALSYAAAMLADSTAWRAWTGADGAPDPAAAARAHLWIRELPQEDLVRPFALLFHGRVRHPIIAAGDANLLDNDDVVGILFEADTPPEYRDKPADAYTWWENQVGGVIADLRAFAGQAGYLNITELTTEGSMRSTEAENATGGDYWQVIYQAGYR